jgi:hypothetical protein
LNNRFGPKIGYGARRTRAHRAHLPSDSYGRIKNERRRHEGHEGGSKEGDAGDKSMHFGD